MISLRVGERLTVIWWIWGKGLLGSENLHWAGLFLHLLLPSVAPALGRWVRGPMRPVTPDAVGELPQHHARSAKPYCC